MVVSGIVSFIAESTLPRLQTLSLTDTGKCVPSRLLDRWFALHSTIPANVTLSWRITDSRRPRHASIDTYGLSSNKVFNLNDVDRAKIFSNWIIFVMLPSQKGAFCFFSFVLAATGLNSTLPPKVTSVATRPGRNVAS